MKIKIAGAALNQTPIDWEHNLSNVLEAIEKAKQQQIKILCLPELCITGYGCEDIFLSEWVVAESIEYLLKIVPHTLGLAVSVGLPIRVDGKLYNCACFIHNAQILGFSAKQFLANDGVHYETRWFTPWQAGEVIQFPIGTHTYSFGDLCYEIEGVKIGFEICEDAWRTDDVRPAKRLYAKAVNLILNPSASHFAFGKSPIRYDIVMGSSERFECTYLYANLLGNEAGRIIYDGEVLIGHHGKLVQRNQRLSFQNVNLVSAEIDFKATHVEAIELQHDNRDKEFEFWEATCLGLYDYMRKSHSKGFVLSLSGGADSSACAVMVSEMVKKGIKELGWQTFLKKGGVESVFDTSVLEKASEQEREKIIMSQLLICAYQGTKNSSDATYDSARLLADSVGATFYSWTVDDEVKGYTSKIEEVLNRKLTWEQDDIALQNIQARTRAPIIWLLTNVKQALLITTSNRSEGDVGYATMDGDTSGSIAPIAGVDKDFIRKWLLWAEHAQQQPGLHWVNALTPTAELRPLERTQTDEKDLMPYATLAAIEREAIRNRKSPVEVFYILKDREIESEENLRKYIVKFFRMWSRNQWKRERIAPSFHLDDFSVDSRSWCRFPILSGGFELELNHLAKL